MPKHYYNPYRKGQSTSIGAHLARHQKPQNVILAPLGATLGITLLSGLVLSSSSISADSNSATANVSVDSSCSMIGTVDSAHTATVSAGTYTEDIGTTTIKTLCNDGNGYAIYAVGYTNDTVGNTILTSSNSSDAIATGTATSGNTSNWAIKLKAGNGISGSPGNANYLPTIANGFNQYSSVPSNYTKVAEYTNATDSSVGSSLTTTYATFVSSTQAAGTYTGQVKYALVHPSTTTNTDCMDTSCLTINFDSGITRVIIKTASVAGTTLSTVTTSGTQITTTEIDTRYYILPIYKVGYTLDNITKATGAAGALAVGAYGYYYYDISQGGNIATITTKPIENVGTMQNLASEKCTANPVLVTDSRGSLTGDYTIQRLTDGNCWMLNNLALGADVQNINSNNTNNPSTTTDSANGKVAFTSTPANTTSSFNSYTVARLNVDSAINLYSYGDDSINAGVYYNYCAASAGNYCYSDSGVDVSGTIRDTAGDICPASWQMPTGGNDSGDNATLGQGDYYKLYNTYDSDVTNFKNALRTPLSGYFNNNSAHRGTRGYFWSSTFYTTNFVYNLYVIESNVNPANSNYRHDGFSVRCVLK